MVLLLSYLFIYGQIVYTPKGQKIFEGLMDWLI